MGEQSMVSIVRKAIFKEAQRLGMSLTGPLIAGDPIGLMASAAIEAIEVDHEIRPLGRDPTPEEIESVTGIPDILRGKP